MKSAKLNSRSLALLPLVVLVCMTLNGCLYMCNRSADLRDIVNVGVGVTHEGVDPNLGVIPPSLGLYAQATDFLNLGISYFGGAVAEWDGRGLYAGPEARYRAGILWWQWAKIDQDYAVGYESYFKKSGTAWERRMALWERYNAPAKELNYDYLSGEIVSGMPIFPRGWQHWGTFGGEIGICDPLLTHFGLHLRLGLDISEVSDFLLGICTLDFKKDDLSQDEYDEMKGGGSSAPPPTY